MLSRGRFEAGRDGEGATGRGKGSGNLGLRPFASTLVVAVALATAGYVGVQENTRAGAASLPRGGSLQQRGDRAHRGLQQRSIAPRNAEPVEKTASIGRPCAEADDFDYYSLGASFEGLKMTPAGRLCAPPPPKVRSANGTLVYMRASRQNVVTFIYGTCEPPSGTDAGGCAPPLSISSYPACEQPHSLYTRYNAGGVPVPHQETRVRDVPAAIFDEGPRGGGTRLEVYAGDARVVIAGTDTRMVKRAADKMIAPSTSPGGAKRAGTELPKPIPGAAEDGATESPKC